MIEPLESIPLESPPEKPLTTWRVVLIAAVVALVVGCLPALTTALVIGDNLKSTQDQIIRGRVQVTEAQCTRANATINQSRRQTKFLQDLILQGTRQSKPFDKVYRQFGLPPYRQRLAQAQRAATGLGSRQPKPFDCKALVRQVERQK